MAQSGDTAQACSIDDSSPSLSTMGTIGQLHLLKLYLSTAPNAGWSWLLNYNAVTLQVKIVTFD